MHKVAMAIYLFAPGFAFCTPCIAADSKERSPMYPSTVEYEVHGNSISVPIGRLLLIKSTASICAVQFPGSPDERSFDSFDPARSFYRWNQNYVTFYQDGNDTTFSRQRTLVTEGSASWIIYSILDTLVWQHGEPYVQCGELAVRWGFPRWISFRDARKHQTLEDVSFAPTNWSSPGDVDASNPQLRWFFYDERRPVLRIPLSHDTTSPEEITGESGSETSQKTETQH